MRLPPVLVCAFIPSLLLAGCSSEQPTVSTPPRPARAVVIEPHKIPLIAQGAGRVQSRYVSQVGFEVGGRMTARQVDIGEVLKKGQKLAELSAIDYKNKVTAAQADVAAAKAAVAQAQAEENRKRILLAKGFAPQAMYDDALRSLRSAEASAEASEANLRIAQNQLNYTVLVAPDDGVVTATGADPGQVVAAGQMVVEISRNDAREAVFAVASEHIARAKLGMSVTVWLQERPSVSVTGAIREISPEADGTTGTYLVKVALNSPPTEMRLGAVVVGRVEGDGPEVASLPPSALLQSGDGPQVWVIASDGKVQRRNVQLLQFDTDAVIVNDGLSAGEKVVTAGVNSLADGQVVQAETEVE